MPRAIALIGELLALPLSVLFLVLFWETIHRRSLFFMTTLLALFGLGGVLQIGIPILVGFAFGYGAFKNVDTFLLIVGISRITVLLVIGIPLILALKSLFHAPNPPFNTDAASTGSSHLPQL